MTFNRKVIAVDFDGTLCINKFPAIGEPRKDVIAELLEEQRKGAYIILWTCRHGEALRAAEAWCLHQSIFFDAVNENIPGMIELYDSDPRKVGADEYWDDKAVRK